MLDEIKEAIGLLTPQQRRLIIEWLTETEIEEDPQGVREPRLPYDVAAPKLISINEYLERESLSDRRHEYVAGQIFAMSGAKIRHGIICGNLHFAISGHVRGGPCQAFQENLRIRLRVNDDEFVYYPDIMVVCGRLTLDDDCVRHATFIAEVLSPSTESVDRREKALHYRHVPGMDLYMLIAQTKCEVTIFRRETNWAPQVLRSLDDTVSIAALGAELSLAAIYAHALVPN